MRRRKAFSREEKLQQIVRSAIEKYNAGSDDFVASELANAVDNVASTRFTSLLLSLCEMRVFEREAAPTPASITGFRWVYRFTSEYLDYAKLLLSRSKNHPHEIRISTRKGVFVEVLK